MGDEMETRQISAMLSQLLSLILMHQLSDKSRGSHTGKKWYVKEDTPQLSFLGQWNQSKAQELYAGGGGRKQKQTRKAKEDN